jgi:hypothetical protein
MAKSKNTTTPYYRNGYEAAKENKPRRSPHRNGTALEAKWLEGYNAFISGSTPPQTPRKKRTKAEMVEARNPKISKLPEFLRRKFDPVSIMPTKPRGLLLLDKIMATKNKIVAETDSELLEILHMELADFEWAITAGQGNKPSAFWEEYKKEHGLDFDRSAA